MTSDAQEDKGNKVIQLTQGEERDQISASVGW